MTSSVVTIVSEENSDVIEEVEEVEEELIQEKSLIAQSADLLLLDDNEVEVEVEYLGAASSELVTASEEDLTSARTSLAVEAEECEEERKES
ncbi:hypothetical protein LTR94_035558, partial [Friedmanniomyces endolithicus]